MRSDASDGGAVEREGDVLEELMALRLGEKKQADLE